MPIQFEEHVSPRGRPYIRVRSYGNFSLKDAEEYVRQFSKDGPYYLKPVLSVIAHGTEYEPAARKFLLEKRESGPIASVVTSPLVRAAVNLMVRFSRRTGNFRMFADENEALTWLDEQIVATPASN